MSEAASAIQGSFPPVYGQAEGLSRLGPPSFAPAMGEAASPVQPPFPRLCNQVEVGAELVLQLPTHSLWGQSAACVAKRAVDVIGAVLGLIVLSPMLLVVALLIRCNSPGAPLFCQERIGRRGRSFRMFKFRTMVIDAEDRLKDLEARNESADGVLFEIADDPRVTRLGRVLRRTNIDELPQLFNILLGHMSLVGPRPLQQRDSDLLAKTDPDGFVRRLEVPPGLTGLWQISDRKGTGSDHMVRLDLRYIDQWSLWLDAQLVMETILGQIFGRLTR